MISLSQIHDLRFVHVVSAPHDAFQAQGFGSLEAVWMVGGVLALVAIAAVAGVVAARAASRR